MNTMRMRTTPDESEERKPKQMQAQQGDCAPQPCSLCSGQLVMDAQGTALFCDECWNRKWFLALESD
jgi:hypothetical protein